MNLLLQLSALIMMLMMFTSELLVEDLSDVEKLYYNAIGYYFLGVQLLLAKDKS